MTKIYDEVCGWPYHTPYGMVAAPKKPKVRKPRKSRAMPDWLKEQRKLGRRALKTPLMRHPPTGFAATFAKAAKE